MVFVAVGLGDFIVGEVSKVDVGDDTAYLKNPGEFKVQMTQQGPMPAMIPLGMFLADLVKDIDIAPCQYLYAGKADKEIASVYGEYTKKLFEAETGLIMPKAEDISAINNASKGNGKIISFDDHKNKK